MTFIGALFRTTCYLLKKQSTRKTCLKLGKEGKTVEQEVLVQKTVSDWASYMVDLMGCRKAEIVVNGKENIPDDIPVVFIGNHQSYLDIPVMLAYSGKRLSFMAKAEFQKIPVFSSWMKLLKCVFLVRESPHQSVLAMNEAVENVKNGCSMMIFPEGHRSKSDGMKPFHPGSFKLAFRSGVPIVPVSLDGTWHLYEENGRPAPAKVTVTFHKPVPTAGLTREQQSEISGKVYDIIKSGLPLYQNQSAEVEQ